MIITFTQLTELEQGGELAELIRNNYALITLALRLRINPLKTSIKQLSRFGLIVQLSFPNFLDIDSDKA